MNYFFCTRWDAQRVWFSEEESKHMVRVLRKQLGDVVGVQTGKGQHLTVRLDRLDKKAVEGVVESLEEVELASESNGLCLAISPPKSTDRLEFCIEKAVELGVKDIRLIYTQRSERKRVNIERMEKKVLSAFKQSGQYWLPTISEVAHFKSFLLENPFQTRRICALVDHLPSQELATLPMQANDLVCIGPEGDFTPEEVNSALQNGFELVRLGKNRLRTETAGVYASALYYQQLQQ